jgi:hypothetical protein
MRKLLLSAILFLLATFSSGQATNPQDTFANAVSINSPSAWLSFNDPTASYLDSVSGSMFGPTAVYGAIPSPVTGAVSSGYVVVQVPALPAMTVNRFSVQFYTAPPAGPYTFVAVSGTAPSLTVASSFTVNVAATTTIQTFTAPANFTAFSVSAGERFGYWVASTGTAVGYGVAPLDFYYTAAASSLPVGAHTYSQSSNQTLALTVSGSVPSAAGTPLQPGFDNTNNANYSASFAYNQWNTAPSIAFGSAMEWNTPWTMLLHINKFNWDKSATPLVLASKGDLNNAAINNNWWQLTVQQNTGNAGASQLCFSRSGPAPSTQLGAGGSFVAGQKMCSPTNTDALPNGFNYDIVVEDSGTGAISALSMWINGTAQQLIGLTNTPQGFGGVTVAITNGGAGYTSAPTVGSTGGGTNCTVAGTTVTVASGAIISVTVHASGCTSAPTITTTGGGGAGAVLTATSYPMTMNSPSSPLLVPGSVNASVYYGPGGTDTAQNPLIVDEFAEFPGNLSFGQVTNIFYETKFYQGLVFPGLAANPPLVIFNSYGCGPDFSQDQTMAMLIGAHLTGLIRLIGIDDDDASGNGSSSVAWFRQMLDQAGLADVPVSVGTNQYGPNLGGCPAANLTAYNANTPQNPAVYESPTTMFRTLFAQYPSTPIYVLMTQTATGYNNFQLSPADGISPLTGLQLQTQNYNNGGWVNAFEGNFATSPTAYLSVLNNVGNLPIYFEGSTPASGGPGIYVSRTALDPLRQTAAATTEDTISGWTNENVAQLISPYFQGGVQIALSGGTGYATDTPMTSIGGGPFCNITGYMASSSGVPSSVVTLQYGAVAAGYTGLGYGCMPAVFRATGSGTNLTVSAITCCAVANFQPTITIGDTISGTGIPTGTTIVSQTSGVTGGVGVYVTSVATTASAATVTRQPTIILTAPTGTGVTMTATMGTFVKNYEGSATASYAVWPNLWSYTNLFTWFQNSLMDTPTTGAPRPY